ncbi:MAG: ABC transporter ATP-binding protein [Candidatus Vogelbacteria bacterium]|nr:ABC transporter ATP-binding protein [Candidatus Vogelbacteria bacterium]
MVKTNTKKTLAIYWQESKKRRVVGIGMIVTVIAVEILEVISPILYKKLFNILATPGPREQLLAGALSIVAGLTVIYLIQWLLRRISHFAMTYFESKVIADLSNYCFAYLHKQSFSFFSNNFVGSLTKKVKWFTGAYEGLVDRLVWDVLPLAVGATSIIVVLSFVNIWLSIGLIVWIIIFLIVNFIFARYKMKFDVIRNEAVTENSGLLADTITNNTNVKLFNGYGREVKTFQVSSEKVRKTRLFTWNLENYFDAAQGFLAVVLELAIIYFAVKLWGQGLITIGDFALIQAYLVSLFTRIWGFGNVVRRIFQSLADAEEMTAILDMAPEIQDVLNAKNLKVKKGEINYQDVIFKYHKTRTVVDRINLKIKPGEKVAFVGPSGAGKTTVVKLLLRMHDLTAGHILIDDQDISKVTQESLWQNVSLVPQDPLLFHRTLKENIRYGRPNASDKDVMAAAKKAHCHEFITQLEHGYDTFVGERGIKLSGGERQRVAIARAILRNAPILVLDEATSSLDSGSEHLIQEALDELMKGKTVLVIAHRLSTIRNVDRIIVISKGKVVEEGTHDDLANKTGGTYAKLWQLQAGGFVK